MESHDSVTTEGINFYVLIPKPLLMAEDNPISRRTAMKLTGAAAATALVAGCSDGGGGGGGGGGDDGGDGGSGGVEIEPDSEILFIGNIGGWEGKSPSDIEGEDNPTIILQEGESYEIGWDEGDGNGHNFEIRDDSGEVVDDYETEVVEEPGEDQILSIEATSEMAAYVCNPHENAMNGEIQVE